MVTWLGVTLSRCRADSTGVKPLRSLYPEKLANILHYLLHVRVPGYMSRQIAIVTVSPTLHKRPGRAHDLAPWRPAACAPARSSGERLLGRGGADPCSRGCPALRGSAPSGAEALPSGPG